MYIMVTLPRAISFCNLPLLLSKVYRQCSRSKRAVVILKQTTLALFRFQAHSSLYPQKCYKHLTFISQFIKLLMSHRAAAATYIQNLHLFSRLFSHTWNNNMNSFEVARGVARASSQWVKSHEKRYIYVLFVELSLLFSMFKSYRCIILCF